MRIAIWHNLPSGGGKRALYNHVKLLNEKGHYLESWTTDICDKDYLPLTNLIIEHQLPVKSNFSKVSKYRNPIKRILRQIEIMQEHCKLCVKEIESKNFDLIFVNSCSFSYMSYISNYATIPTTIYLGEPCRRLFDALPENVWQAPPYDLKLINIRKIFRDFRATYAKRIQLREEIKAAKKYNSILVNSLFSRESVMRAYGIDSKICYLGIDQNLLISNNESKEPYVVSLGSIDYFKSIHKAIKVISKIPSEIRPVLKWIANGVDEFYYKEIILLAKDLNVQFEPQIKISDEAMYKVLSKAAIMIYLPSLEPFGLAPLEANMCGTYVVAIAEGGVRESITNGKNGDLLNGFEEKKMALIINKFTSNLGLAKTKGEEARSFVIKNWNQQKMANNIELEIFNLVKRTNS